MEVEVVSRKKKFSKKGKKNWRKHADVKDVEEYLEGRRREEIFGVPASEKADKDLFFVEKNVNDDDTTLASGKLTRHDIRHKPLQSEIFLQPNPAIKGFCAQKRRSAIAKVLSNALPHSLDSSSDENEYETSASYSAMKQELGTRLVSHRKQQPEKSTVHMAARDLWAEEPRKEVVHDEHYLKVTRRKTIKKPKTMLEVPSLLNSVELPHPGMSYNPSFEDHQSLLREAVSIEERKLEAAKKLEKRLQLAEMTQQQREEVWLEEMKEGILGESDEGHRECKEDGEEDNEGSFHATRKRPIRAEERKTKKQRRRELLIRQEEIRRKNAKASKMKMDEVYRLRSIKKEITRKETTASQKKAQSLERKRMSAYLTKRLGKHAYEEPDVPVQLSSEVAGSLRTLKVEGNLAEQRFKSLQRRNIIEPRKLVRPHRKYKLLIKEKRSAKLPEEK